MKFDLDWAFDAYPPAFTQDMVTVLRHLRKEGIKTLEEIIEYGDQHRKKLRNIHYQSMMDAMNLRRELWNNRRRCGACGQPMNLWTVNDQPCNQVGGKFQSMWECSDPVHCGETEFSELLIDEEAQRWGLGKFYGPPKKREEHAKVNEARDLKRRNRAGHQVRNVPPTSNQPRRPGGCCGGNR